MEGSGHIEDGDLQDRLQNHARAFESLLALTPAREYFGSHFVDGQDPSDQWNRKKQSKEEKRVAKKAKLDPANQRSALDVIKDRELKRKRELGIDQDTQEASNDRDTESQPIDTKRQRIQPTADEEEARRKAKAEKKKEKRQQKNEKQAKQKSKAEAKKAAKKQRNAESSQPEGDNAIPADPESDGNIQAGNVEELDSFDASGLVGPDGAMPAGDVSSVPPSPSQSPAFDVATNQSTASSSSSVDPAGIPEASRNAVTKNELHIKMPSTPHMQDLVADSISGTSSPKIQLPNVDQAQLQERLRQRIEALRARRKADGPDGKPAKSRQELLDQRRKKDELRKAAKKEKRRQWKEAEQEKQEAQLRGSGSPLSGDIFGARSPQSQENNFSFSRLAFEDGSAATADLSGLHEARKAKARSDPKAALDAAMRKQAHVAGLDAEKRADIAEKDLWLNAKKRAHGERIRDDTSLLKKALKRKEKQKGKSEKEWQERETAVVKGRELKQKRRDANLLKRREEKGQKGKKKPASGKGGKKKGRPGFEGRFKA